MPKDAEDSRNHGDNRKPQRKNWNRERGGGLFSYAGRALALAPDRSSIVGQVTMSEKMSWSGVGKIILGSFRMKEKMGNKSFQIVL